MSDLALGAPWRMRSFGVARDGVVFHFRRRRLGAAFNAGNVHKVRLDPLQKRPGVPPQATISQSLRLSRASHFSSALLANRFASPSTSLDLAPRRFCRNVPGRTLSADPKSSGARLPPCRTTITFDIGRLEPIHFASRVDSVP